jgi:hypothetical protein
MSSDGSLAGFIKRPQAVANRRVGAIMPNALPSERWAPSDRCRCDQGQYAEDQEDHGRHYVHGADGH